MNDNIKITCFSTLPPQAALRPYWWLHCVPTTLLLLLFCLFPCLHALAEGEKEPDSQGKRQLFLDLGNEDWKDKIAQIKGSRAVTYVQLRHPNNLPWSDKLYEEVIPLPLIEAIVEFPRLQELVVLSGRWNERTLAVLVKHPTLKRLHLGRSQICDHDFKKLGELTSLEEISFQSDFSPRCFITLAKLPNFRKIRVEGYGDHFPHFLLDEETTKAIASLDGRLEEFFADGVFDDEMGIFVGPGVARELFKLKSLEVLRIDSLRLGLGLTDFENLKSLDRLTDFNPGTGGYTKHKDWDQIKVILDEVAEEAAKRHKHMAVH